jgi:UDP-glucose 4-epimerase
MILVTGGAGYIGSHVVVELMSAGHDVVVVDNLSNSSAVAIERIEAITDRNVVFHQADTRDCEALSRLLRTCNVQAVCHLAGLKSVAESNAEPLRYADHNLNSTLQLLIAMEGAGVKTLIMSSSATVYGAPQFLPMSESHPLAPTNIYGRSKLMSEQLLTQFVRPHSGFRAAILRYFNPVGAHESGLIGEDPIGPPNNLMPYIAQVAVGRREYLNVWGNDHDTVDGTGVRDYIHVVDLAKGHVRALETVCQTVSFVANLGSGRGHSVLEVIRAFEVASGRTIPYHVGPPRSGDLAAYFADPRLAYSLLGWRAERDLLQMCKDHWRWQLANPNGYETSNRT